MTKLPFQKGQRPACKENEHPLLVIGGDGGRVQTRDKDEKTGSRWKEDKVLTITSCLKEDGNDKPPQTLLSTFVATMRDARALGRLAELMELPTPTPIRKAIKALNAEYAESGRSFRVEQVAGGYQLLTLPEYGEYLRNLHQREADSKLTKAALETLAIIAYKQPTLRAEIESIRGVQCGETIRSLMEKHLVKIAGRAEEPGRPILYGTTKRFLELFGLNSLNELPKPEELSKPQA